MAGDGGIEILVRKHIMVVRSSALQKALDDLRNGATKMFV